MQFSDIANQMPDTVELYSLQAGVAAGQNDGRAIDLGNLCHDILDLAYAVSEMDLIVSVDSAVLHLAGALGRPSIGLIYQPTDWRWRLSGNGPYESMRLLRQRFPGEWLPVLEQLGAAVLKAKKLGRRRDVPTDVYPEQSGVETAGGVIGHAALQPHRNIRFMNPFEGHRNTGAAEVLLGHDIGGHLGPFLGHPDVVHFENNGPVGVQDLTGA
jgi:hypothetical protein